MPLNSADVVRARPTKAFFIDMITRDLTITDCILDLMDNSVDQAVQTQNIDVMKTLIQGPGSVQFKSATVSLTMSDGELIIEDTCGGISIEEAQHTVFLFGNPATKTPTSGLSVYGIGMKRAFFKLGRTIRVQSATDTEWFTIDIDVDEWKGRGDEDWDFRFSGRGKLEPPDFKYKPQGTTIRIAALNDEVARRINQVSFLRELKTKAASCYSLFIAAGLEIRVNGEVVQSSLPTLATNEMLTPAHKTLRVDPGAVEILIYASITPREDKVPRGWYVFCNGRMVLEADRSRDTGWGDGLPQWHSKYAHFVGYVYFKSNDVLRLPWTTTKRGIVFESPVYQNAVAEMTIQARPILTFLSRMYAPDLEEEDVPEREILTKVKAIPLDQVDRKDAAFAVDLVAERKKKENTLVTIQYKKPRKQVDRIKKHIRRPDTSARGVGELTFDYYIKQECE